MIDLNVVIYVYKFGNKYVYESGNKFLLNNVHETKTDYLKNKTERVAVTFQIILLE